MNARRPIRGFALAFTLATAILHWSPASRAQSPSQPVAPGAQRAQVKTPAKAAEAGQPAPALKLQPPGGGVPISIDQFKGKPTLVVFWATWCRYCLAEMPDLKKAHDLYTAKGLRIILVTGKANQTEEDVVAFQIKQELPFISLWDPEGAATQAWGVTAFPTNFFVDAEGVVRARGYAVDDAMKALIQDAMKAPAKKG